MCVNLEGVAGSRGPGEGIRMAYEKSNMYVNLEGVAGTKILRINFFSGPNSFFYYADKNYGNMLGYILALEEVGVEVF